MTTKSRLALLTSLAATPAFAAPFLAIGDNAELFVTARTEARYEDNLTFASSNEIEDYVFEFTPGAELTFGKSSLTKGSVVFFERFLSYRDTVENNESLANLIASSSYQGAKLTLNLNASFRELAQNSRDTAGLAIVRTDVSALGVGSEVAVTEKSKVGLGAAYNSSQYIKSSLADLSSVTVPLNYYFAVRPKLDLSSGVQFRATQVDVTKGDANDMFFNVGARGEFTPKLVGNFAVGYNVRDSENNKSDDESIGLKGGLTYLYSVKTQFTLDVSNDFANAASGDSQETASIEVGVRSAIAVDLSAYASVAYENVNYSTIVREDDYYSVRLGLSYTLNQYLTLDGSYSRYENSSDNGPDFTANVISISASARY